MENIVDYARIVSLMANSDLLDESTANQFCRDVLPRLLAELEVMSRVSQGQRLFTDALATKQSDAQPEPEKPKKSRPRRSRSKGGRK